MDVLSTLHNNLVNFGPLISEFTVIIWQSFWVKSAKHLLSRSHFLIDFCQKWHSGINPKSSNKFVGGQNRTALSPILSPKTTILWREYAFSSVSHTILKLACYQNYPVDYSQLFHSDKDTKCPSLVVETCASQIQDGGRPPSWK